MRLGLRISLVAGVLLMAGCHQRTPVAATRPPVPLPAVPAPPPIPPSTLALQSANRAFADGDYASASRDFERYLQLVTTGGERDQALFYLGLIAALPEAGRQDWARTSDFFTRLAVEFPRSPLKPAADVILSVRQQATQLSADVARLNGQAAQVQSEVAQLRGSSAQLTEQVTRLKTEAEQLNAEIDKREQRIRQLNTELERLIRVDSERRPRP